MRDDGRSTSATFSGPRNVLELYTVPKSVVLLSRNRNPNTTQNEDVYAISCRPQVPGAVTSGQNVNTAESYDVVKLEVASSSGFRDIQNKIIS